MHLITMLLLGLLILASWILAWVSYKLGDEAPAPAICALMGLQLAAGLALLYLAYPMYLIVLLPLFVTGRQFAGLFARATAEKLYGSTIIAPMPSDFSRARALARQGNVNEALKEYRGYFEENPGSATPLFEAAQFLEEQRRYGQCVGYYREIMKTFEHQKGVWAEASVRLAAIFSDYLNDWKQAEPILNEVAKTVPRTEQARQARERLHSASRQGALTI
jgi:tetratricopeptide (TPR) repeat protein